MDKSKIDYTLYLCTDRGLMSCETIEQSVEEGVKGGCTVIQLREKDCTSREFYELAVRVKKITDKYSVPLIINDRLDIAQAVDCAGVHLGQSDMPCAVARKILGEDKIIGISAATLEEAKKITNKDIADELGGLPQEKMHCSVMGQEALEDALKKYYGKEEIEKEAGLSQNGDKIVCTCFNVTENQIWEAIKVNGLKTVEEVTNYTKAGGACGRCKGVIKDIIETYLRKEGQAPVMTAAQKILKIGRVIDQQISPQLQKDGGDIELIDVEGNKVKVKLTGMCSGCKNATMTLKAFVESVLKDKVDSSLEVEQV